MSNTCRSMQILKCFVLCMHAHYVMITRVAARVLQLLYGAVSKLHYELTLGAPKQNFQKQSEPETGSIGSLPLYLSVLRKKVYQFWFLTKPHSIVPLPLLPTAFASPAAFASKAAFASAAPCPTVFTACDACITNLFVEADASGFFEQTGSLMQFGGPAHTHGASDALHASGAALCDRIRAAD